MILPAKTTEMLWEAFVAVEDVMDRAERRILPSEATRQRLKGLMALRLDDWCRHQRSYKLSDNADVEMFQPKISFVLEF